MRLSCTYAHHRKLLRTFSMDAPVATAPAKLQVTSRTQYDTLESLTPSSVAPSPLEQFHIWFTAAQGVVREPEAMALSTCTPAGVPSVRIVLFKQLDARGFVFYTNYTSRKSRELAANPHAALAFYWREISRQVRVVGRVERVSPEETAEYFRSRPVGSRLGAWASRQSAVVRQGEVAERLEEVKRRFGADDQAQDADVPVPEFWGGWRVIPEYVQYFARCSMEFNRVHSEVEFWAGKPSRLHDRVRYLRIEGAPDGAPQWKIECLAP